MKAVRSSETSVNIFKDYTESHPKKAVNFIDTTGKISEIAYLSKYTRLHINNSQIKKEDSYVNLLYMSLSSSLSLAKQPFLSLSLPRRFCQICHPVIAPLQIAT
jgi:hypothetical protein